MLSKNLQKTFAVFALAGFMATGVGFNITEAASHNPPQKVVVVKRPAPRPSNNHRYQPPQNHGGLHNYKPVVHRDNRRYDPPRHHRNDDKDNGSTTGNLITGLIIGGILGHVITNNS